MILRLPIILTGQAYMTVKRTLVMVLTGLLCSASLPAIARSPQAVARHQDPGKSAQATAGFSFTVAGASADCGHLIMPAIAKAAHDEKAKFHWHLGDMRSVSKADVDFMFERYFQTPDSTNPTLADYQELLMSSIKERQLEPFRVQGVPLMITLGGRDDRRPLSRLGFRVVLRDMYSQPLLSDQRRVDGQADNPKDIPSSYYHWRVKSVDFISLDNATDVAFDRKQLKWLDGVLLKDMVDSSVRTVVVGATAGLPHSAVPDQSMCLTKAGTSSGERVYKALAQLIKAGKRVYVLSSHAHYYRAGIYDTEYWRDPQNGGVVIPGYVVGTAGAGRMMLAKDMESDTQARSGVYGYLKGTVNADGAINFSFHELDNKALQSIETQNFESGLAAYCLNDNKAAGLIAEDPMPTWCDAPDNKN